MITQWNDISEKPAASIITAVIMEVSVLLNTGIQPQKYTASHHNSHLNILMEKAGGCGMASFCSGHSQ